MACKILIADDEPSLRLLVRASLESNPEFELFEAVDGTDAIDKINIAKPDILILDIMMPGLSGFEVCDKIKKESELKDIIVVMLSAKGKDTDKDWAKSVGADHFLTKPFSPMELLELITQIST